MPAIVPCISNVAEGRRNLVVSDFVILPILQHLAIKSTHILPLMGVKVSA